MSQQKSSDMHRLRDKAKLSKLCDRVKFVDLPIDIPLQFFRKLHRKMGKLSNKIHTQNSTTYCNHFAPQLSNRI